MTFKEGCVAGVRVTGVDGKSNPELLVDHTALQQPGMPMWQRNRGEGVPGPHPAPSDIISISSSPPYTEFKIKGAVHSVHGPEGDALTEWLPVLMEVSFL